MPAIYDEALWRSLYRLPQPQVQGQPEVPPVTYGRRWGLEVTDGPFRAWLQRRDDLVARGVASNSSVVVVGCAYGFLIEYLIDAGISNVWGIEPSPWVWANAGEFRADVLPRVVDATVGVTSIATIRALLSAVGVPNPQRFNFVIDEDAAASHSDAELPAFIAGCEALLQGNQRARIVHIVSTLIPSAGPGDSSQNWKVLSDWQAVAPSHTWVDARSI